VLRRRAGHRHDHRAPLIRRALLALPAVLAAAACDDESPSTATIPGAAVVEFVIDGDTVDVVIDGEEERVRLIGIDTPESRVDDGPPECFGPEAAAFTAELLPPGTDVRLERDVVARDDYGRLLAYVFRLDDDLFVNEAIVRQGYAAPLTIEPNDTFAAQFVAAASAAEDEDLGLWTACAGS
jgi:micrococcal nuclease